MTNLINYYSGRKQGELSAIFSHKTMSTENIILHRKRIDPLVSSKTGFLGSFPEPIIGLLSVSMGSLEKSGLSFYKHTLWESST